MTATTTSQGPDVSPDSAPAGAESGENVAGMPLEGLFAQLGSSPNGLTAAEVGERLRASGPNEPTLASPVSGLTEFARLFANPLVLILLAASVVSVRLGETMNALLIAGIVLVSIALDFFQTFHSQRAAEKLREGVAPTATALRDGQWVSVRRREIVRGDVVRLAAGDLVPADARLIEARDLHVQQASLTGESLPVEKEATPAEEAGAAPRLLVEAPNVVFLGTSVVSGTGKAVVFATGRETAFGDIAVRLTKHPPETEFERGTRQFGLLILRTVFLLVLFILLWGIALRRDPLESLLFSVALAVGLTPEFLPMIITVTLGQGALRMARKNVIVKHLAALQNFGSMDVLCSDKTGTLTTGEMALDRCVDPFGTPSERVREFAYWNSYFETGIRSPLDAAILKYGPDSVPDCTKLDEIPFDFERRRLSVVVARGGERLLVTKGAPEGILPLCSQVETVAGPKAWEADARSRCEATFEQLSAAGYRVLAVASRNLPEQAAYRAGDERELTLVGFLAFVDPPLPGVAEVVTALNRDGVRLKIITGDNEAVTRNICQQVGVEAGAIVRGEDLERMSDTALAHVAENTTVFARVSPAQKNRIILALKGRGHVVGYMGDGINDAPSLHAADVGISVSSAVDVAKDAAEIILTERGLDVLHQGVREGRRAFANVMKYLLMGTSSNFGNMFSMAGASLFLPFLPMLPTQILLNSFLYDVAQLTIPTDNVDDAYLTRPRRWDIRAVRAFMLYLGPLSSLYDFLTFYVLLVLFRATPALFHTGWFVESLATQTLVLFVIRTTGNPLRSRPSLPLIITTLLMVLLGILLPFLPFAPLLGFTPLPGTFFIFLFAVVATYLVLVEGVKRWLLGRDAAAQRHTGSIQ